MTEKEKCLLINGMMLIMIHNYIKIYYVQRIYVMTTIKRDQVIQKTYSDSK